MIIIMITIIKNTIAVLTIIKIINNKIITATIMIIVILVQI